MKKEKKEKNKKEKVLYNCIEIFKCNKPNYTDEDLKDIFNKKLFKYIQNQENLKLMGCKNE